MNSFAVGSIRWWWSSYTNRNKFGGFVHVFVTAVKSVFLLMKWKFYNLVGVHTLELQLIALKVCAFFCCLWFCSCRARFMSGIWKHKCDEILSWIKNIPFSGNIGKVGWMTVNRFENMSTIPVRGSPRNMVSLTFCIMPTVGVFCS